MVVCSNDTRRPSVTKSAAVATAHSNAAVDSSRSHTTEGRGSVWENVRSQSWRYCSYEVAFVVASYGWKATAASSCWAHRGIALNGLFCCMLHCNLLRGDPTIGILFVPLLLCCHRQANSYTTYFLLDEGTNLCMELFIVESTGIDRLAGSQDGDRLPIVCRMLNE